MNAEDAAYLKRLAGAFRQAHRETDYLFPEDAVMVEGARWVKVTHELANEISDKLEEISERMV